MKAIYLDNDCVKKIGQSPAELEPSISVSFTLRIMRMPLLWSIGQKVIKVIVNTTDIWCFKPLSYTENMKMTMGNPGTSNQKTTVSTPFFPAYYPRDFENEQHFKCLSNQACRIHVNFIDFQISPSSVLEVSRNRRPLQMQSVNWSQHLQLSEGNDSTVLLSGPSRPPVFITSGATLSIKFKANGATALGYQALVSFILLTQVQEIRYNPRTGKFWIRCKNVLLNILLY